MAKLLTMKSNDKKLSIKNLSQTQAEIAIYGEIGGYWDDAITAKSVLDALKDLPETVNTINLRINSPGGDVFEGISIYNLLRNSNKKIIVYVDGLAASIASIIALAGEEVHMGEGAMFMIHRPMTMAWGNSSAMMEVIDRLDDVEEQLLTIYQKRTKLDRTELKNYISKDTYFDSAQSVEFGFATAMMEEDSYVNMAACMDRAFWIKNKSDIVTNYEKAKQNHKEVIGNFLDNLEG
jgi:ATP-dependent protease ClpP protease subunit